MYCQLRAKLALCAVHDDARRFIGELTASFASLMAMGGEEVALHGGKR